MGEYLERGCWGCESQSEFDVTYTTEMTLHKKIYNIRYALIGIKVAWREEFSFKIQIAAAILVTILGWYFGISSTEWLAIVIVMGAVLSAEALNTALEELCDMYKSDPDPHIGKIKDLAAAAVLIASVAASVVGAIIFVPHLLALI